MTQVRESPERLDVGAPWLMLIVLFVGQFMAIVDVTIVNIAMPNMRTDLAASGAALQLIVAGYTISYAMLLITGARLGDLVGRRRMYLIGLSIFTLSSLLCGLAPNATTLIIARFVQGVGAAMLAPQIMSIVQVRFTGAARATALSAYAAVVAAGAIAGMFLGGVLVNADLFGTGWRPVFLVNVPLGLLVAVLVPRLVPADGARGTRKLDLAGLLVSTVAVFLIVFPLVLGHEQRWPAWTFVSIAAGLALVVVFVRLERRVADPLLRLDVLRAPGMASGMLALGFGMMAYGSFLFIFTLHLQGGLGESALRASLVIAPAGVTFGLFGFYWRKFPAWTHHLLTPVGFALAAVAYLLIAVAMADGSRGGGLLPVALALFGAAMGTGFSPLLTNALVHVPLTEAADASGLLISTLQLGQVVGVATVGSLFLTLAGRSGQHPSASALTESLVGIAILLGFAVLAAMALARAVLRARKLAIPQ